LSNHSNEFFKAWLRGTIFYCAGDIFDAIFDKAKKSNRSLSWHRIFLGRKWNDGIGAIMILQGPFCRIFVTFAEII